MGSPLIVPPGLAAMDNYGWKMTRDFLSRIMRILAGFPPTISDTAGSAVG